MIYDKFTLFYTELLARAIADAHARTCTYTTEQLEKMKEQSPPTEQVETLKSMVSAFRSIQNCQSHVMLSQRVPCTQCSILGQVKEPTLGN